MLTTLPSEKNGSVDVTFANAITHQKHLAQSGRSLGAVRRVQWTFSIHSAYLLKSQSENKKFSWSVWMIFCYKLKEVKNSNVLHCFELQRIVHISATRCPIQMGLRSKCIILNGRVVYIVKSKLNIANMWLIPLNPVIHESFMNKTKWSQEKQTTNFILDKYFLIGLCINSSQLIQLLTNRIYFQNRTDNLQEKPSTFEIFSSRIKDEIFCFALSLMLS